MEGPMGGDVSVAGIVVGGPGPVVSEGAGGGSGVVGFGATDGEADGEGGGSSGGSGVAVGKDGLGCVATGLGMNVADGMMVTSTVGSAAVISMVGAFEGARAGVTVTNSTNSAIIQAWLILP